MQTKAEEEEAIRKAREEAAVDDNANSKDGSSDIDAEKGAKDAVRAEREEEEAVAMSAVGAVPDGAVNGGSDAGVASDDKADKYAV